MIYKTNISRSMMRSFFCMIERILWIKPGSV